MEPTIGIVFDPPDFRQDSAYWEYTIWGQKQVVFGADYNYWVIENKSNSRFIVLLLSIPSGISFGLCCLFHFALTSKGVKT